MINITFNKIIATLGIGCTVIATPLYASNFKHTGNLTSKKEVSNKAIRNNIYHIANKDGVVEKDTAAWEYVKELLDNYSNIDDYLQLQRGGNYGQTLAEHVFEEHFINLKDISIANTFSENNAPILFRKQDLKFRNSVDIMEEIFVLLRDSMENGAPNITVTSKGLVYIFKVELPNDPKLDPYRCVNSDEFGQIKFEPLKYLYIYIEKGNISNRVLSTIFVSSR